MVDTDNNCIDSFTWQCIPITSENCPRDEALEQAINEYKDATDQKYSRVLTRFPRPYTHPARNRETELGDLMAEGLRAQLGVDLVLLGSGSIRKPQLGPIVTLKDYMEIFPFNDPLFAVKFTGEQLRRAVRFMLRDEAFHRPALRLRLQLRHARVSVPPIPSIASGRLTARGRASSTRRFSTICGSWTNGALGCART